MSRTTLEQLASVHVDRARLEKPSDELRQFVRSVADDYEPERENRSSERFPAAMEVVCIPFDSEHNQCGVPVIALSRNVSVGGISLVYTRPIPADFLMVTLDNGKTDPLNMVVEVLRCRRLGRFFEIAGKFTSKLER